MENSRHFPKALSLHFDGPELIDRGDNEKVIETWQIN